MSLWQDFQDVLKSLSKLWDLLSHLVGVLLDVFHGFVHEKLEVKAKVVPGLVALVFQAVDVVDLGVGDDVDGLLVLLDQVVHPSDVKGNDGV